MRLYTVCSIATDMDVISSHSGDSDRLETWKEEFEKSYGVPFCFLEGKTVPNKLQVMLNRRATPHRVEQWKGKNGRGVRMIYVIKLWDSGEKDNLFAVGSKMNTLYSEIDALWKEGP